VFAKLSNKLKKCKRNLYKKIKIKIKKKKKKKEEEEEEERKEKRTHRINMTDKPQKAKTL
jgi:protein subunit release factor B